MLWRIKHVENAIHGALADFVFVHVHAAEGGNKDAAEADVVEADDGQIMGHLFGQIMGGPDGTDTHQIVVSENGRNLWMFAK